jgi:hypothetical protein
MSMPGDKVPSAEDKAKLDRLFQEVVTRLDEVARIVGRNLGKEHMTFGAASATRSLPLTGPPSIKKPSKSKSEKTEVLLKVICDVGFCLVDEHGNCVGVYDEKAGVCRPC